MLALELEESLSDGTPDPSIGDAAEPTDAASLSGLRISSDAGLPANVLSMSNIQSVVHPFPIVPSALF